MIIFVLLVVFYKYNYYWASFEMEMYISDYSGYKICLYWHNIFLSVKDAPISCIDMGVWCNLLFGWNKLSHYFYVEAFLELYEMRWSLNKNLKFKMHSWIFDFFSFLSHGFRNSTCQSGKLVWVMRNSQRHAWLHIHTQGYKFFTVTMNMAVIQTALFTDLLHCWHLHQEPQKIK